jgi:lipopolysaccharide transport system ATP-binding protein
MRSTIRAEAISKEYRLGVINHGMMYRDLQSWMARRFGRHDPNAMIGADPHGDSGEHYWALKEVSFDIKEGERVGLVGRNGAGKSTLLKVLSRITAPTEGRIGIRGRTASLLEVGTGFHHELTGRENVFLNGAILGMRRREIQRKFDEIVDFSEISQFIDTPVKRYSSGMNVRLAFAVAAHLDSEILLADEVLAVGDAAFQKKCLGKMEDVSRNQGRTVVFVSHNAGAIRQLCDKGFYLEKGRLIMAGPVGEVLGAYLDTGLRSEASFDNPFLVSASVCQDGDAIVVTARYIPGPDINLPFLSIKLIDMFGSTMFTNYARNCEVIRSRDLGPGDLHVRITSPKLLDGTYRITLLFGNSDHDLVTLQNCLSVDVHGMVALNMAVNTSDSGFIHPLAEYNYG